MEEVHRLTLLVWLTEGVVTGWDWTIEVWFLTGAGCFVSFRAYKLYVGLTLILQGFFLVGKVTQSEADHSHSSSVEVKNVCWWVAYVVQTFVFYSGGDQLWILTGA